MVVVESFEHVNICTNDIKKSVEFYTLFLDFELLEETESYALLSFDELRLKVNLQEKDSSVDEGSEDSVGRLPIFSFMLDVDDFTEAIQLAEQENVPIISGPDEFESGAGESILLKDPGANLIEFFYRE